ncbi:surface-adhesin E family protein [Sphingomonas sp. ST-64]|uniref:Surface-adhesin E family protein n=1 Tax=Sphingomonas plantiphila TaxID=3163295 RepID=A0ABW8YPL6_9SPHN
MKPALSCAAIALIATPACATDWRPVVADTGTLIHLIDAETLPGTAQAQPKVRTLTVFAPGERTDFQALEMTSDFDCVSNRVRMVRTVGYDEAGKPIGDETPANAQWEAIEPDTGYAGLAEVVCGKRPVSSMKLAGAVPIAAARDLIGDAPADE